MNGIPWLTVLTTPRRPQYLQRTLVELDCAGAAELAAAGRLLRWIAVDGDPEQISAPPGWVKVQVGDGLDGTRRAMLHTIQHAADGQAPYLLYFEDDVIASRNAVAAFAALAVPDECGFVTAFEVQHFHGADVAPMLTTHRTAALKRTQGGFWGNQALKLPAGALQHLQLAKVAPGDPPNSSDVWLGEQLAGPGGYREVFGVINPSLFQHVGAASAVDASWTLAPWRVAANWAASRNALDVVAAIEKRAPF